MSALDFAPTGTDQPGAKLMLGEILVRSGALSDEMLDVALARQVGTGRRLGEVLIDLHLVGQADVLRAVAEHQRVPYLDLDTVDPDPKVVGLIAAAVARRFYAVPVYRDEDGVVVIAMANPRDVFAIDDLRSILNHSDIIPVLAEMDQIVSVIDRFSGGDRAVEAIERAAEATRPVLLMQAGAVVEEAPIVQLVDHLLSTAAAERASDVHIEPTAGDTRIRFRVDGVLREVMTAPAVVHAGIISRVKVTAQMDIAERRLPQDGRITAQLSSGGEVDMRVTTMPTIYGEAASVRLMSQATGVLRLDELDILPEPLHRLRELIHRPWGAVLVTGPTGSGKTTTLYAMLDELNDPTRNILTIEDPVECRLEGIKQVQVNAKAGLGFATALRAFLRSDPDVILVGEIRDLETAEIAADAALTGHVVLSSLHTNNAASSALRLVEIGLEPFRVIAGLVGVVAQRLVRRLCERCKAGGRATAAELKQAGIPDHLLDAEGGFPFWRPVGCPTCGHTGYRGRFAVHEVMTIDEPIKTLITERAPVRRIEAAALEAGMWTLKEDAFRKASTGITSVHEVLRVVL